jgi:hypothetical protein
VLAVLVVVAQVETIQAAQLLEQQELLIEEAVEVVAQQWLEQALTAVQV